MTGSSGKLLSAAGIAYLGVLGLNRSLIVIRGNSMTPTFGPGDRLLTLPAIPRWLRPGQIVVLRDPNDREHLVVKRLIDLDAETADVRGDAPDHSTDSRSWGRIPIDRICRLVVVRCPGRWWNVGRDPDPRRR